jgi:hypothetical protein
MSSRVPAALAALVLLSATASASIWGAHYGDSPSTPGFIDGGDWNPSGPWVVDVALATLGTEASLLPDGGKPFYQMVIGCDDPDVADFAAMWFETIDNPFADSLHPTGRQAWCSEAVCYWHHKAGIPYASGFRNSGWVHDWQHRTSGDLCAFFNAEEDLGARGRWISPADIDYDNFWPGWNAPCPGAYIQRRGYDPQGDSWIPNTSHSQMVDEMTVYQTAGGRIIRVRLDLVEGNSNAEVRDDHFYEDVLAALPDPGVPGIRNTIKGFGVCLDASGQPVYDPDRIHWETIMTARADRHVPVDTSEAEEMDLWWRERWAGLINYARRMSKSGPVARSSAPEVRAARIPDGTQRWEFPSGLDEKNPRGVEVEVDLLDNYPLPIRGLVLTWKAGFLPQGYWVEWAGSDRTHRRIEVPVLKDLKFPDGGELSLPVPLKLAEAGKGIKPRYLTFGFPKGTFPSGAVLEDLTFIYDSPSGDDPKPE